MCVTTIGSVYCGIQVLVVSLNRTEQKIDYLNHKHEVQKYRQTFFATLQSGNVRPGIVPN